MKKPNLFIVGQPKSGTTALTFFLDQHKEISISNPKEPHFLCKDFHKLSDKFHKKTSKEFYEIRTSKEYSNIFKENKIMGEASTNYLYSKTSSEEIIKFNKKSKIIAIFREPVSFVRSLHMQYSNDTSENIENLKEALELENDRKQGKNIPSRVRCPSYLFYSERVKYSEQINRFLKQFPKNQIKIIIFDDFKKDNLKTYKEVLDFLEIDNNFTPDFKQVHSSKAPKSKFLNKIFRNPKIKVIPKLILPPRFYDKIQLKIQKLLMKEQPREPLDSKLKKQLMIKYKPEVIKLNNLLKKEGFLKKDRNLIKEWGYDKI